MVTKDAQGATQATRNSSFSLDGADRRRIECFYWSERRLCFRSSTTTVQQFTAKTEFPKRIHAPYEVGRLRLLLWLFGKHSYANWTNLAMWALFLVQFYLGYSRWTSLVLLLLFMLPTAPCSLVEVRYVILLPQKRSIRTIFGVVNFIKNAPMKRVGATLGLSKA